MRKLVSESFPEHAHTVVYPGRHWKAYVPQEADVYCGHSLGALLLLGIADALPRSARLLLWAPFSDFRMESDRGGRVSATQLKLLIRMLERNAQAAVNDFYERSGLAQHCEGALPYAPEDLVWGIRQLLETSVNPAAFTRVDKALIGSEDALLDADKISRLCHSLDIIPAKGHGLEELLPYTELS